MKVPQIKFSLDKKRFALMRNSFNRFCSSTDALISKNNNTSSLLSISGKATPKTNRISLIDIILKQI